LAAVSVTDPGCDPFLKGTLDSACSAARFGMQIQAYPISARKRSPDPQHWLQLRRNFSDFLKEIIFFPLPEYNELLFPTLKSVHCSDFHLF
jgi:hypothetical protein